MDKKLILTGTCKYFRLGSKGNRRKLVIDDYELSEWIKQIIQTSVDKHKLGGKTPITNVHNIVRNEKIEVRFVD